MRKDQQQNVSELAISGSENREIIRLQKLMDRAVCFRELREIYPQYPLETMQAIASDVRVEGLREVKEDLHGVGIDLSYVDKVPKDLGFLGNNLVQAAVIAHKKERRSDPLDVLDSGIVVAGVCFPDKPTLQSLLPLLAVKNLFEEGRIHTAYFAMPAGAYAAAGIPRQTQYQEIVGFMQQLFGEKLGKQVFIIPDTREELMAAQEIVKRFGARNVTDTLARKKYPFGNLFGYTETAGYGSDIVLPALAEGKGVTIIADYRQYESIHAGIKMGEVLAPDCPIQALLYTLTNPVVQENSLREVSQDDGVVPAYNKTLIAETNALFYEAMLLFPEERVRELYAAFRKGSIDHENLERQVRTAKQTLLQQISPASIKNVRHLEDVSIQRLSRVFEPLRQLQERRMREGLYVRR